MFEVDCIGSELHGRRHARSAYDPPDCPANYRPVHTNPAEIQSQKYPAPSSHVRGPSKIVTCVLQCGILWRRRQNEAHSRAPVLASEPLLQRSYIPNPRAETT